MKKTLIAITAGMMFLASVPALSKSDFSHHGERLLEFANQLQHEGLRGRESNRLSDVKSILMASELSDEDLKKVSRNSRDLRLATLARSALKGKTDAELIQIYKAQRQRQDAMLGDLEGLKAASQTIDAIIDKVLALDSKSAHIDNQIPRADDYLSKVLYQDYVEKRLAQLKIVLEPVAGNPAQVLLKIQNLSDDLTITTFNMRIVMREKGRDVPVYERKDIYYPLMKLLHPGQTGQEIIECSRECQSAMQKDNIEISVEPLSMKAVVKGDYRLTFLRPLNNFEKQGIAKDLERLKDAVQRYQAQQDEYAEEKQKLEILLK